MNNLQRFMRDYSVPTIIIVVGVAMVEIGICMQWGLPGALVSIGAPVVLVGMAAG